MIRRHFLQAMALSAGSLFVPVARSHAIEQTSVIVDNEQDQEELAAKARAYRRADREVIVVIDPGHGGGDPGAIGHGGTYEKHVTLQVAHKFVRELNKISGFKAFLTRTDDHFVPLRRRVAIARQYNADLFISLHADAFRIASARGASVYCLSAHGRHEPDKAVRLLVQRENDADLIGGNLSQVSDSEVRGILLDLSQRDSINRAMAYGNNLLLHLKRVPTLRLHFSGIKQAGFAVLRAPDIPSVLVEMAFLSNRDEEVLLRREDHQESLVAALTNGTKTFFHSSQLA